MLFRSIVSFLGRATPRPPPCSPSLATCRLPPLTPLRELLPSSLPMPPTHVAKDPLFCDHPEKHASCRLRRRRSCPGARRSISHLPALVYCGGARAPLQARPCSIPYLHHPLQQCRRRRPRPCLHRPVATTYLVPVFTTPGCSQGMVPVFSLL